ncbi:MAG: FAD-dependent oxidoreductase [Luteococcus sp.]|uniref:FAD-dependent oxidoreductase n=1 Tax=Luteococcus sp. TaxID=1969402 RepID=UPI00264931DD|nr:FAD-dependent oxidoreductase [Luteococcus sp.]MDN5562592.1 FAD-dependent oxidoreductase [Luteococcus sp.]
MIPSTARPSIVIISPEHCDHLLDEFGRYARDYELHCAPDAEQACQVMRSINADGGDVALIVSDSLLPDAEVADAFEQWRALEPNARRLVFTPWERFAETVPLLRTHLARSVFDASLLMPRGVRDEEFHTAVTELLSDWGNMVGAPVVANVLIIAEASDALGLALGDYLHRTGMPFKTVRPDAPRAKELLHSLPSEERRLPLVKAPQFGKPFSPSSVRELAAMFYGRPDQIESDEVADVVIVGAGPAGLAASVYASSEGLTTHCLESEAIGGQAGTSSMIRNYLGFPRGISGMRLAQRARAQALRFGTRFWTGWPATGISRADGHFIVHTDGGYMAARTVVVAAGVTYRRLGVDEIEELVGKGVHYGAVTTAARELEGGRAVVVGGGNSAGQAAMHLARFAESVTIVVRREGLTETMSAYLVDEIEANPRIHVRGRAQVVGGGGDGRLEWITLASTRDDARERIPADGLFLLIGAAPHCDWLPDDIALDEHGFILTGAETPRSAWHDGTPPAALETTMPGVFAVGDTRSGSMKRVASAAGEGAGVVPLVHAHLDLHHR